MAKKAAGEEADSEGENIVPSHVLHLFEFFQKKYSPGTITAFSKKMTTHQIYDLLQEHCPSESYNCESVYIFLVSNNYIYETPGGSLDFVWLLNYDKTS